jgi:hypothetical protein
MAIENHSGLGLCATQARHAYRLAGNMLILAKASIGSHKLFAVCLTLNNEMWELFTKPHVQ